MTFAPQITAFVCPGQGSQQPGMAAEFMTTPSTRELFEQADDTLGFALSRLMRQGDEAELRQTQNAQPALLMASMAVWSYLQRQSGADVAQLAGVLAGHSVGEYTAACLAGSLSFTDALLLVRARGQAMAEAMADGEGAMAAILGAQWADITSTCQTTECYLANDNAEGQVVISGLTAHVDEASNMLAMQEVKKIIRLNVSGAFHTPMMAPAAQVVADRLAQMSLTAPAVPLVMNSTAAATQDVAEIQTNLVSQITGTVRWRESMQLLAAQGVTRVIELGSGKVLAGLAKRCDKRLAGRALNSPQDVDMWLEALEVAA